MTDMPITALAPWFGGKRTLAPIIVQELGDHRTFWEPFCGSLPIIMAKPPCSMETVNDLHGDIINLARVVRDPQLGAHLYRCLRRTIMHEDFLGESNLLIRDGEQDGTSCRLADSKDLSAENVWQAYHYFIASWMGRNGTSGTPANRRGTYCVRYTNRGGHACKRWSGAVNSIPAWRRRLANVTILRRDAFALIQRIADDPGTAIYCDPPYLVKGSAYLHDDRAGRPESVPQETWNESVAHCRRCMAGLDESGLTPERVAWHYLLAQRLARFKAARVVVSYYYHEALLGLYPGWRMHRLQATKAMVHAGRRDRSGAVEAPEVLLINGPSLAGGLLEGIG